MTRSKQRLCGKAAAVFLLAALAPANSVLAAESRAAAGQQASGVRAQSINLAVGKSIIVDLPRDAAEVFVADPKVANAIVRSARKLYLMATGAGQTSIFALDSEGRQFAAFEITTGRDIGELDRILKTAMPHTTVVPRTINDTIILTGSVDSASEAQMAVDIAKGFVGAITGGTGADGKVVNSLIIRGRDMVMLKVTIAEVQREVLKQLGVSQGVLNGNWGSVSMKNAFVSSLSDTKSTIGNLVGAAAGTTNGLGAEIKAYERNGVARILAEPTVTAVSGENAKFTAGGEVPISAGDSCDPVTRVCTPVLQFKPYGVTLNFTPLVLSEGRILLRVATEVSEIDPTTTVAIGSSSVPGFRTRKNETTVELPSGGSIVSAGLIQTTSRQTINGLPGLMNLPILGALFRSRDYQRKETELMIIVTPYIAKSVKPSEVAKPTDGFADATDPQSMLLGRVNRIYSTANNPQLITNFKGRFGFIAD